MENKKQEIARKSFFSPKEELTPASEEEQLVFKQWAQRARDRFDQLADQPQIIDVYEKVGKSKTSLTIPGQPYQAETIEIPYTYTQLSINGVKLARRQEYDYPTQPVKRGKVAFHGVYGYYYDGYYKKWFPTLLEVTDYSDDDIFIESLFFRYTEAGPIYSPDKRIRLFLHELTTESFNYCKGVVENIATYLCPLSTQDVTQK
ncbi:hypothetical protein ACFLZ1_03150 [Patescibacteria group bacterium]